MRFVFFKKVNLGKGVSMNIGTRGISFSKKIGKVTLNSGGGFFINLGKGLGYRGRWK